MSDMLRVTTPRRPYQRPTIQVVLADPVTELLQQTGSCGTLQDGCGQENTPPIC